MSTFVYRRSFITQSKFAGSGLHTWSWVGRLQELGFDVIGEGGSTDLVSDDTKAGKRVVGDQLSWTMRFDIEGQSTIVLMKCCVDSGVL